MKNYYEILEVNEKASQEIINKVFKMHIKKWHPDLYQGDEKIKAETKTKEFNEAYSILSDEKKRATYDQELQSEKTYSSAENYELETLKEENEMLKRSLEKRDMIINNLINPSSNTSKEREYYNHYEREYEEPQSYYTKSYEKEDNIPQEEIYKNLKTKDLFIRVLICFIILMIGTFFIIYLLTNLPIFEILGD